MAWKTKTSNGTQHNDSCTMAFGRLSAHCNCPRCEELKSGSAPRKAWDHRQKEYDRMRRSAMAQHFAPGGKHDQIVAVGGVDTAFEW
jgi:hypothetical protein